VFAATPTRAFAAFEAGRPVAYALLLEGGGGAGLIEDVYTTPDARGRGLARAATRIFTRHLIEDLGFHRVQLECYGYNERAIRHFERSGFVREGVKRKAYWRGGEWVDGVSFGLVREDLDAGALDEPPRRPG
jgi:RimJ/RimL family protein N-acetyltransferase